MLNKIKNYTAFFAATLNIVASAIFIYAEYFRFSKEDDSLVAANFGIWFAFFSGLLWLVFVILYFVARARKK